MEINTSMPVSNQVQRLETTSKASEVKREKEEAPGQQAVKTEESPDYRLSLSDASKKAIAELTRSHAPGPGAEKTDLSEEEAAQLAQQASQKLAQSNTAIANQAIQKAVDLFT